MSDLVERLLAAMTLQEKLGQLNMIDAALPTHAPDEMTRQVCAGLIGSVLNVYGAGTTNPLQQLALEQSRLRIPLIFGFDVLHGHRTICPIPLAEACAFDPPLWERTARIAMDEAGRDGITLNFAPMLDVCRDPRWGRIAEGPGEDALVASRYAEAKVRGFQGADLAARENMAATAKHFVAYGAPAGGRDYGSADISERELAEVYLPPFEAAVKAGVAAIMPSFNDLAGIPMTAHGALLKDLVRGRWGFEGVLVSDYNAVGELIAHGVAEDLAEAAALALAAGIDIDMQDQAYLLGLPAALDRGLASVADIDRAVRRVLTLKQRLGLFDDPYRRVAAPPLSLDTLAQYAEVARDAGRRSIVLLKNERGALPLKPGAQRIALIGPLGDAPLEMFGCWFAAAGLEAASILDGLRAALPQADISHVPGVTVDGDDQGGIAEAAAAAHDADTVILSLGESKDMTGEAHSRGHIDLPGCQRALAEAVLALGKPTIAILTHGRPLALPWLFERADAVLATWQLGSQAGHAIAEVLTGAWNPSGRLAITWPLDGGQIPIFHSHRPTGRPGHNDVFYSNRYTDMPVEPQFPFGFGLSYTRFRLGSVTATPEFAPGETVTVLAEVTNEGALEGEETVFLFLRDPVASIARPVLELKGFAKGTLAVGERQTVRFILQGDDFALLDRNMRPRVEPGAFEILVGPCADRSRLSSVTVRCQSA